MDEYNKSLRQIQTMINAAHNLLCEVNKIHKSMADAHADLEIWMKAIEDTWLEVEPTIETPGSGS